jgi:hypothetical protein
MEKYILVFVVLAAGLKLPVSALLRTVTIILVYYIQNANG